jgi:WD40 repeat protein
MDKTAKLWNLKSKKLLSTFTGHIDYINCVRHFYSYPKGITGSNDRTIKEWDFEKLKLISNV